MQPSTGLWTLRPVRKAHGGALSTSRAVCGPVRCGGTNGLSEPVPAALILGDVITPAARLRGARLVERPGLRTFASARFRILLAGTLLLIGLAAGGSLLMRQAADPAGQFGVDLADYQRAAQRMAAGGSPYAPEMLAGPVDAQGVDRYRYPPVLAQLLIPVAGLPMPIAAALWGAAQLAAAWLAVWVASSAGGAARGLERALWTGVAATFFLSVFDALAWLPLALVGSALMIMSAWRAMGGTRPAPTAAAARPLAS